MEDKINNYLAFLNERIIKRLEIKTIKESCTITLLLIFAAIDSLSKITCSLDVYCKGNKHRFKNLLEEVMSDNYALKQDNIYDLRCDIVHSGINTKIQLSNKVRSIHLEVNEEGILIINTNQFRKDFIDAYNKIQKNIKEKGTFYYNAIGRLNDFYIIENDNDLAQPSPAPNKPIFNSY